jgi:hypothetical protein
MRRCRRFADTPELPLKSPSIHVIDLTAVSDNTLKESGLDGLRE